MGNDLDDIKCYLPKYLSEESYDALLSSLKDFPNSDPNKFYTSSLQNENIVYQGDVVKNVEIIDIVDKTPRILDVMVISNTCDMDVMNKRLYNPHITCVPLFRLEKYRKTLIKSNLNGVEAHIDSLKQQKITPFFYLPPHGVMPESFINFQRIYNIPNSMIDRNSLKKNRVSTFSDYGAYLLLFKISLHFTRIQDKVDRGCAQ